MRCLFLYLAQVAKVDHMPFGKDTGGKGILVCFLPVLFLQEWRMITARIYTYIFNFNTLNSTSTEYVERSQKTQPKYLE